MKIDKTVAIFNGIAIAFGLILSALSGFDIIGLGLLAILIAFLNIIMILVYAVKGNRNAMLSSLIIAGITFTIGFSICSNTRMDFR